MFIARNNCDANFYVECSGEKIILRYRSVFKILLFVLILVVQSQQVFADGTVIDKVYDPYVQMMEREIEYRVLVDEDSEGGIDDRQRHTLGFGRSLSDRIFLELYIVAVDEESSNLKVEAYEAELKWQLTEQGELSVDWGLLFEVERETKKNIWEASTKLIAVKEWSNWVATGNVSLLYEWGSDIDNEWETIFSSQLRYRYSQNFEPALEIYVGQDTKGIGPIMTGLLRFKRGKKIHWEFGPIFAVDSITADISWKMNLEYEF